MSCRRRRGRGRCSKSVLKRHIIVIVSFVVIISLASNILVIYIIINTTSFTNVVKINYGVTTHSIVPLMMIGHTHIVLTKHIFRKLFLRRIWKNNDHRKSKLTSQGKSLFKYPDVGQSSEDRVAHHFHVVVFTDVDSVDGSTKQRLVAVDTFHISGEFIFSHHKHIA